MKKLIITFLCCAVFLSCGFVPPAAAASTSPYEIYVSPTGSDAASGSFEKPLKTLAKAKTVAAELAKTATSEVKVIVRGGTYNVGTGLNFTVTDSGTETAGIHFQAYQDEKVSLTNTIKLDNTKFSLVTDEETLNRIPAEARGKVYAINLTACGITYFGQIYRTGSASGYLANPGSRMLIVDDSWYTIAKWPNGGYGTIKEVLNSTGLGGHKFSYSENVGNRWATATEPWVFAYFYHLWSDDLLPIKEIDCVNKTILTKGTHWYGIRNDRPFSVLNLLEELDIPGEWFLDTATGMLYMYPKTDISKSNIQFSPNIDNLLTMTGAEYITFSGITFEGTCNDGANLTDCESVVFDNCEFRNIGRRAMNITSGYNCGIKNSYIHDIGKGGVFFEDGDFINLTHSNSFVDNCHIERFGIASLTYTPAVKINGVGNRVSHCEINNGPHLAIQYAGIDNVVEYNEIYDVLQYTNDAGVIYGGRSWTNRVVIRYNYVHDCKGVNLREDDVWATQGVYMDDGLVDTDMYGNIFDGVYRGMFSHYGRYSEIQNNIFLNCEYGIKLNHYNGWQDLERLKERDDQVKKLYAEGGMEAAKSVVADGLRSSYNLAKERNWDLYVQKFPWLETIVLDDLHLSKYNVVSENIIVNSQVGLDICEGGDNVVENNYVTDTFTSIEELMSHVPGFEPIDMSQIGIQNKEKKPVGSFRTLGPANGAYEVSSENVALTWEGSQGASSYELIVAEDEAFSKIVLHENLNGNSRLLPKLKSGGQKYYWKVIATSVSDNYTDVEVPNANGVQSFRTKMKELADTTSLATVINESWDYYNKAVESQDGGTYIDGAKASFKERIVYAESFLAGNKSNSPFLNPQGDIDNAALELKNHQTGFLNSQITQTVDIKNLLSSAGDWNSSSISVRGNTLTWANAGAVGYVNAIEFYKKLKFKATFEPGDNGWTSVGLRVGNSSVAPWLTSGYVFLVKKDVVELQKFGNATFFYSVPNDCLQPGTEHEIEFGAVNDASGDVRITLVVDGKEIYNVLDEDNPVQGSGFFTIYNSDPAAVTLKTAE